MDSLLASGTVEETPEAIANFLRQHKESLDTTQIGEYFGHHDDLAVQTLSPLPLHTHTTHAPVLKTRHQHYLMAPFKNGRASLNTKL